MRRNERVPRLAVRQNEKQGAVRFFRPKEALRKDLLRRWFFRSRSFSCATAFLSFHTIIHTVFVFVGR